MKTVSGIPYWPSRDPIGEKGGNNLYGFVGNDSFGWYDYLGAYPGRPALRSRDFGGGPGIIDYQKVDELNHKKWLESRDAKPSGKCCENGKEVEKVSVYVVNRGSPINQQAPSAGLPQWSGGHIDLVIPGCGVGMVGFYGNQAGGQGASAATFSGIPGTMNIGLADWTRSPIEGGRINYLAPEGGLMVNTPNGPVRVPGLRSYICEIKVCPADAKKMCQRAQQLRSSPGSFRMLGRNCSTIGCDILNAGGAGPGGISGIDNPQSLQNQVESSNCFYGYTALGPDGQISVQRATDQSPPPAR